MQIILRLQTNLFNQNVAASARRSQNCNLANSRDSAQSTCRGRKGKPRRICCIVNQFQKTCVVVHTINTENSRPFRHKLPAILFERRQYFKQEFKKLMFVSGISPADLGACPNASRPVSAPKSDGSLRCASITATSTHKLRKIHSPCRELIKCGRRSRREVCRFSRPAHGYSLRRSWLSRQNKTAFWITAVSTSTM